MGYNWKNKILWCRLEYFWEVLERENNWNYEEVQAFIKDQAEQHFKGKGITPLSHIYKKHTKVEQHFKGKGITPFMFYCITNCLVEEHFKLKGVTPYFSQSSEGAAVEEHFKLKGIR